MSNKTTVMITGGEIAPSVEYQKARTLFNGGKREQAERTMRAWAGSITQNEINGLISGEIPVQIVGTDVWFERS